MGQGSVRYPRRSARFSFLTLVGWACAAPIMAQPSRAADALTIGSVRQETLPGPVGAETQKDFRLTLSQGQSVRIDASSETVDPEVQVYAPGATASELLASNDDFGGSLNARARITAAAAGVYLVRVIGRPDLFAEEAAAGGTAAVELLVSNDVAPTPLPIRALSIGTPQSATLGAQDTGPDEDGLVHIYEFDAAAAQRLIATVESENAATPRLLLRRAGAVAGGQGLVRGVSTRERNRLKLVQHFEEPGRYQLLVRGIEPARYTLFANLIATRAPEAFRIVPGSDQSRRFSFADPQTSGNLGSSSYMYQPWVLNGQRGQRIRLEMCSKDDLDPLLQVVAPTLIGDKVVSQNDDTEDEPACGNDKNARLEVTFAADGPLRVYTSPLRPAEGSYTLSARLLPD